MNEIESIFFNHAVYLTSINKFFMDGYFDNRVFISLAEQPRSGLGRLIFLGF